MKGIIDRFEGEYAIIEFEDREMVNLAKDFLPPEAKEGDVIELKNGQYVVNLEETRKRAEDIKQLSDTLWGD